VFAYAVVGWLACEWVSRQFGVAVSDAFVAMSAALTLFLLPACTKPYKPILDWRTAESIPWGVLILFGGGLALAGAFESMGLAKAIGASVKELSGLPAWVVALAVPDHRALGVGYPLAPVTEVEQDSQEIGVVHNPIVVHILITRTRCAEAKQHRQQVCVIDASIKVHIAWNAHLHDATHREGMGSTEVFIVAYLPKGKGEGATAGIDGRIP
jgi:hypothetical protein